MFREINQKWQMLNVVNDAVDDLIMTVGLFVAGSMSGLHANRCLPCQRG